MAKADEVRGRVSACREWLAAGWTHRQIEKHVATGKTKWKGRGGRTISQSQVQVYIARAQAEIDELALPHRKAWLRRIITHAETMFRTTVDQGEYRSAVDVLKLLTMLTGAKRAAEEEQVPDSWETLAGLLVRLDDLDLSVIAPCPPPPRDPASLGAAELKARRLIRLLEQADDSTAGFRAIGPPPADEVAGRLWVTRINREALRQRVIFPGISPKERSDAVYRHGGTAGILSQQAELAELLQQIRQLSGLAK